MRKSKQKEPLNLNAILVRRVVDPLFRTESAIYLAEREYTYHPITGGVVPDCRLVRVELKSETTKAEAELKPHTT